MKMSWEYIAGFFDGEGCVTTVNFRHHPNSLASTTAIICQSGSEGQAVLTEIQSFLLTHGIKSHLHDRGIRITGRKRMHALQLAARSSVVPFLAAILPYVRVKKVVVQDTLRFHRAFRSANGILAAERARDRGIASLAKIGESTKAAIQQDFAAGMSQARMSKKYGLTVNMVTRCIEPGYLERTGRNKQRWLQRKAATRACGGTFSLESMAHGLL